MSEPEFLERAYTDGWRCANCMPPNFNVFGFHVKPQPLLDVVRADGDICRGVIYQGWDLYGTGDGYRDVTAWRPSSRATDKQP